MTPRVYLYLLFAIALSVGATWFVGDYMSVRKASAVGQQRGQVLETTSGVIVDGQQAQGESDMVQQGIAQAATQFQTNQQEAQANEPQTRIRAATVVPDSVRNNYRERRRARERLGCLPGQCAEGDAAGAAAER